MIVNILKEYEYVNNIGYKILEIDKNESSYEEAFNYFKEWLTKVELIIQPYPTLKVSNFLKHELHPKLSFRFNFWGAVH